MKVGAETVKKSVKQSCAEPAYIRLEILKWNHTFFFFFNKDDMKDKIFLEWLLMLIGRVQYLKGRTQIAGKILEGLS